MDKRPRKSRRLLLLAALVSLGSHWLVLRGVDIDFDTGPDEAASTVMFTAISANTAPVLPPPKPRAAPVPTPPAAVAMTPMVPEDPSPTPPGEDTGQAADEAKPPGPEEARTDKSMAAQSGQLQFQVFLGDGEGEALAGMTHTFQFTGNRYEISSRGEALGFMALLYSGLLTQHSSGVWDGLGFSTRLYSEQRGKKPENRAQVDGEKKEVTFSNGNQVALANPHVLDRLSVMYQLGLQLRSQGNAYEPPPMDVLSSSALEKWQFARMGIEKLRFGELGVDAIHYQRRNAEGQEKTGIDIWYDTGTDPWPLQIRLTDKKGMVITQKRALLAYPSRKTGSALP